MLNEYNGYFLGIVTALISVTKYYKNNRAQSGVIGRCCLVLMLIYFATMYLTYIVFPMPVQPSVIRSGFHEKENYWIPFSELMKLFDANVTSGELTLKEFTREYLAAVLALCLKIIPIGLFTKLVFRINFKRFLVFSLCAALGVELLKWACNLITTVNYISLVTEHMLYTLLGLLIGFYLYYPSLWLAKTLRDKSVIMSSIYELLK